MKWTIRIELTPDGNRQSPTTSARSAEDSSNLSGRGAASFHRNAFAASKRTREGPSLPNLPDRLGRLFSPIHPLRDALLGRR